MGRDQAGTMNHVEPGPAPIDAPLLLQITDLASKLGDIRPVEHLVPGLVYDGGYLHWWYGPPKRGKSMMARYCALRTWEATGRPTLWIDHEVGWHQTGQAIIDLGLADSVNDIFAYVDVLDFVGFPRRTDDLLEAVLNTAREVNAAAVTVDSAGKQLSKLGFSENENDEVTRWTEGVLLPASRQLGVPVHVIDHVTKDARGRDGWARGAGEKIGACDLAWQVTSEGFSASEQGTITCASGSIDRFGRMPSHTYFNAGGQGDDGVLELTETEDAPVTDLQQRGTEARQTAASERRDKLVGLLREHGMQSTGDLAELADVDPRTIQRDLNTDTRVRRPGRGLWVANDEPPSIA